MTGPEANSTEPRQPWARVRAISREIGINLLIIGAVVLVMMWWQREGQRGGGGKLTMGAVAPGFSLADARTGGKMDLQDLQGRPTILNFWATWCGPCVRELPILEAVHQSAHGRYHLVTITQEPPSVVVPFLEERNLTLTALFDPGGTVSSRYKASQIPTTVILDAEGQIVHDFSGGAYEDILRDHMNRLTEVSPQTAP